MLRKGRYAHKIGRPLNWAVVIDFGIPPVGEERAPEINFSNIRKRIYNWWRYRRDVGIVDGPLIDWCSWEAPNGKAHVNWLINVPDELVDDFRELIEQRCDAVIGPIAPDTVHQQPIWNTNGAMKYALKGTETEYARKVEIRASDQGLVWGKRAFCARALGPSAREAAV